MKKFIRIQNEQIKNINSIIAELSAGNEVIIQFSKKYYTKEILKEINILCKHYTDNLCIRFYGHYDDDRLFDCNWLEYLPDIKRLNIDCLKSVDNFAKIKELQYLINLNIGIYEFIDNDFLSWDVLKKISVLVLSETKNNNIDLQHISEYKNLRKLFICGHIKNIDSMRFCKNLEFLSLSIPSKQNKIEFINALPKLRKLRLILGGRESIEEVKNTSIEELEILRVRGFNNLKNLSKLPNLQKIAVEDQKQLLEINFDTELPKMKSLEILNCKSFKKISGLLNLPELETLRFYKTALLFDDFIKEKFPKSLKYLAFYTMNKKEDEKIKKVLDNLGYYDKTISS